MKTIINFFNGYSRDERTLMVFCITMLIVAVPLLLATGPAQAQSGNVYGAGQVQVSGTAVEAVVLQVEIKKAEPSWQTRAAGAGIGSALGALLASNVSGNGRHAASVIGATAGGLLGERTTNAVMTDAAQEIILQVLGREGAPPRIVTVIQPAPFDRLVAGETVYMINTAGKYRVVRQYQQPVALGR